MSEPKWTQGGWRYHHPSPWPMDIQGPVHRVVGGHEAFPTAFVPAWLDTDAEEAEANARLISAAPDLYAAAKLALHEMCHTNAPRNSFTDAVDALDAALAKARGDS